MANDKPTIYILYNARASITGKLDYAIRKLRAPADQPRCSACDLTHGGLRLSETEHWNQIRRNINADVKQWHKDELNPKVLEFVKTNNLEYPMVLGQNSDGEIDKLLSASELTSVSKDHAAFLELLFERAASKGVRLEKL
ncbi:MAG: hypothetical protein MMC23_008451 [Stictis urceolatum]|nr:hypothetical protein [Stictis urceolata]